MTRLTKTPVAVLPDGADPARRRLAWIRVIMVIVTLAAYARLCTADFSNWDDPSTTYNNPHLNPPSVEGIAWFWGHSYMDIYAPLTFTLWGVLLPLSKVPTPNEMGITVNSWIFHTTNVLLHIAAMLAAFELLRRLVRHNGAAALGALLFALHPVQVEAVGWVSGMKDLLYGLLSLAALWQYVEYVGCVSSPLPGTQAAPQRRTQQGKKPKAGRQINAHGSPSLHYTLALLALAAALFSKPTAVVTPLLALVIDRWLLHRPWKKSFISLWPWFVLAIIFAIIAKLVQPAAQVSIWPLWSRPIIAADALAFYLFKLVYPAHLAIDYGRNPVVLLHTTQWYWTWIAPAVLALVIWIFRKKRPGLVAAGLLFLICLLPVLGLTPFDFQYYSTVTDHYLYLAMIGPALAAAFILARYWRTAPVVAACVILAALGVRTFAQTAYWQNTPAIFEHALEINPHSGAARERLGGFYNQRGIEWSRDVDACNRQIRDMLRTAAPDELKQKEMERDQYKQLAIQDWQQAVRQYSLALKENPKWPKLRVNLSGALANLRQWNAAMDQLREVMRMQSELPPILRGGFERRWFDTGLDAYYRGDDTQAAADFRRSLSENPENPVAKRAYEIVTRKIQETAVAAPGGGPASKP